MKGKRGGKGTERTARWRSFTVQIDGKGLLFIQPIGGVVFFIPEDMLPNCELDQMVTAKVTYERRVVPQSLKLLRR